MIVLSFFNGLEVGGVEKEILMELDLFPVKGGENGKTLGIESIRKEELRRIDKGGIKQIQLNFMKKMILDENLKKEED